MTTSNPFDDLLSRNLGGGPQSQAQIADMAKTSGYQVIGNNVVGTSAGNMPGSVPTWETLDSFAARNPASRTTFLDQAAGLTKWQYEQSQGAADRQFARNNAQIDKMSGFVDEAPGRFDALLGKSVSPIDSAIKGISGFGESQAADFERALGDMNKVADRNYANTTRGFDSLLGGIDKSVTSGSLALNTAADQATAAARSAITDYNKGVNEEVIRSTVQGIRSDMNQQMKMLQNGIGPDGRRLSPAEQQDAIRQLRFDTGKQVSTVASQVRASAENTLATLRTHLSDVILEGGKMKEAGAELGLRGAEAKAGIEGQKAAAGQALVSERSSGLGALLQSQDGQRALKGMSTSLAQFKSQMINATDLASLNFEMAGRSNIADMVKNNPETVFGLLTAFMSLGGVATAPGGRNIAALRI